MSEVRFGAVSGGAALELKRPFTASCDSSVGLFQRQRSMLVEFARLYRQMVRHHLTVPICSLLIGFVSAYDSYLTVMYVDSLQSLELNPVGRYMMGLDDPLTGGTPYIAVFLGCKFAGTILVLFVLQLLWVWRRQLSSMVAMKVAFAQTLLAFMLLFGGHKW